VHLKAQSKRRTYSACCEPIETFNERYDQWERIFVWRTFDPVLALRVIKFATKPSRQGAKSSLALALLQHLPLDSHRQTR
jgi:hypothetical protein